jgi:nucleoside 2-deoxyribosyltransferase
MADGPLVRPRVYLVGSLRQPEEVLFVTKKLEGAGFSVFSDWCGAGPEADDYWQRYEKGRGRNYRKALQSPAAQHVFKFDLRHILMSDMVVMVGRGGKSANCEIGFAAGRGKPTFLLMDEPGKKERWDVMTLFVGAPIDDDEVLENAGYYREPFIAYTVEELIKMMQDYMGRVALDSVPDNPARPA